jgi:hypothetical protein
MWTILKSLPVYIASACIKIDRALHMLAVSIPIHILVSYDSTILLWTIDTYHDGILIW